MNMKNSVFVLLVYFALMSSFEINAQLISTRYAATSRLFKGSGNLLYRAYAYTNNTYVTSAADFDSYFKAAVASSQTVNVKSIGKFNSDTKNTINVLNWSNESDINGLSLGYTFADNFLYKIEGCFIPRFSGIYTFTIEGDDAVDLFIDNTNVVNHYGPHGAAALGTHTGTISLTAGQIYRFRARHEEVGGGAALRVFWRKPNETSGWFQDPDEIADLSSINESTRWSASSVFNDNTFNATLAYGQSSSAGYHFTSWLESPQGWSAKTNDSNQWLTYDLGSAQWVLGIVTQGREDNTNWVTSAKVEYSLTNTAGSWTTIFSSVNLNTDGTTKKTIEFPSRVNARYIKVSPIGYSTWMTMRFGVIY